MGIFRLLILAGLAWLGLLAVRAWQRRRPVLMRRPPRLGGAMVRCAHCGVHVPRAEAITRAGATYCCEAHANVQQPG